MNVVKVTKKRRTRVGEPQMYTCVVEFTQEELEKFTDDMVVQVSEEAVEDLTSVVLDKMSKDWLRYPATTSSKSIIYTTSTT